MTRSLRLLAALFALAAGLLALPAFAQSFPALSGRVVDDAHVLSPTQVDGLTAKLAALETQSQRQLVVATVPSLQGYDVETYANGLFRSWKLGETKRNDGVLLLVAPTEHKVRIEVGYGLEGILTDALSSVIINTQVTPKFKAGDMPGGIDAGATALIQQLQLPEDQARQVAAQAPQRLKAMTKRGFDPGSLVFFMFFFFFFVLPFLRSMRRGGRGYRSPGVMILPGGGWGSGGGGGWGGGGGDWGGGGGGFSGGGGSSGGGGASGSW